MATLIGPVTDPPPSPWTVINDFSKTIITLSSALFALAVTFSVNLIGKANDSAQLGLLVLCWIGLLLSILCAVIAHGFLVNYLRMGSHAGLTVFFANASFIALVLAAAAFLGFGVQTIYKYGQGNLDATTSIEKALNAMPGISGLKEAEWKVHSLNWNEPTKAYELLLSDEKSSQKFLLGLDTASGRITKVQRLASQVPAPVPMPDLPAVQQRLASLGYRPGPIDGIMGPRTLQALRQMQKDSRLPVTGYLDKETLDRLNLAKPAR